MDSMKYVTEYVALKPRTNHAYWLGRYQAGASPRTDERVEMHCLSKLASAMAEKLGPCPFPQAYLLQWLGDEIDFIQASGVPDGATASALLGAAYLKWIQRRDECGDSFC